MDGARPKGEAMKLRAVAAVAVLVSAVVHLRLWFEGFSSLQVIGPAFMVNAVAGLVIAVLLIGWRHWIPLFLAAGFGLATFGAFLVSATVGLYGVHEQWVGWPIWTSAITEVTAVAAAVAAGANERVTSVHRRPAGGADRT